MGFLLCSLREHKEMHYTEKNEMLSRNSADNAFNSNKCSSPGHKNIEIFTYITAFTLTIFSGILLSTKEIQVQVVRMQLCPCHSIYVPLLWLRWETPFSPWFPSETASKVSDGEELCFWYGFFCHTEYLLTKKLEGAHYYISFRPLNGH